MFDSLLLYKNFLLLSFGFYQYDKPILPTIKSAVSTHSSLLFVKLVYNNITVIVKDLPRDY